MTRTVAEKMGVRSGGYTYLHNAPDGLLEIIQAPPQDVREDLDSDFGYIHAFAKSQQELSDVFPKLKSHLTDSGALWVSWPKGKGLGSDLTLQHVIRIGYGFGLVESTCLSIDAIWSALKFTHPKPGKVYNNSHAELNLDDN